MIEFVLTRRFFSTMGIFGELHEATSGFRCKTVERPQMPSGMRTMTAGRRGRYALDCGRYWLVNKYDAQTLLPYFRIVARGVFRDAAFMGYKPLKPGCIAIGRDYALDGTAVDGQMALAKMAALIDKFINEGRLVPLGKQGMVALDIVEDATYHHEAYQQEDEEEELFDCKDW